MTRISPTCRVGRTGLVPLLLILLAAPGCTDEGPEARRTILDVRLDGTAAGALFEVDAPSIGVAQTPHGPAETWTEDDRTYVAVVLAEAGSVEFRLRINNGAPIPPVRPLQVVDAGNEVLDPAAFTTVTELEQ